MQNPDAEAGASGHGNLVGVPGWALTGSFTVDDYGDTDRLSKEDATKVGGGNNYFFGGPGKPLSTATQTVNVAAYADEIDKGSLDVFFGADLGAYGGQSDVMDLTAVVLNATGGTLATLTFHGPNLHDRKTAIGAYLWVQALPAGARSIRVTMTSTRQDGSNNDGYADNISLFLRERAPGPTANILSALKLNLAVMLLTKLPSSEGAAAIALVDPSVAMKILSDHCDDNGGSCGSAGSPTGIVALLAPKVAIKILSNQPPHAAKILALLPAKVAAKIVGASPAAGAKILAKMQFASAVRIMRLEPANGARKALLNAMPKTFRLHMKTALGH